VPLFGLQGKSSNYVQTGPCGRFHTQKKIASYIANYFLGSSVFSSVFIGFHRFSWFSLAFCYSITTQADPTWLVTCFSDERDCAPAGLKRQQKSGRQIQNRIQYRNVSQCFSCSAWLGTQMVLKWIARSHSSRNKWSSMHGCVAVALLPIFWLFRSFFCWWCRIFFLWVPVILYRDLQNLRCPLI
jgi:hypothetical protein